jgi:hypothetical protein
VEEAGAGTRLSDPIGMMGACDSNLRRPGV